VGFIIGIGVVAVFWRFLLLTAAEVYQGAGMGEIAAAFEARSALTGAGYTTPRSQMVADDPASSDAASMLFVVGYVGPMAILGLLGLSFIAPTAEDTGTRGLALAVLIAGLVLLDRLGLVIRVARPPARFVAKHLFRAHIESPWVVFGDQAVAGLTISAASPLVHRTFDEQPFGDGDVTLLEIQRRVDGDSQQLTTPAPDEQIQSGDTLVVYGTAADLSRLRDLAAARSG